MDCHISRHKIRQQGFRTMEITWVSGIFSYFLLSFPHFLLGDGSRNRFSRDGFARIGAIGLLCRKSYRSLVLLGSDRSGNIGFFRFGVNRSFGETIRCVFILLMLDELGEVLSHIRGDAIEHVLNLWDDLALHQILNWLVLLFVFIQFDGELDTRG